LITAGIDPAKTAGRLQGYFSATIKDRAMIGDKVRIGAAVRIGAGRPQIVVQNFTGTAAGSNAVMPSEKIPNSFRCRKPD